MRSEIRVTRAKDSANASFEASFKRYQDTTGASPRIWPAIKVPRAAIAREIERLCDEAPGADGRRRSVIVHPCSQHASLTPGIRAIIEVILPKEEVVAAPQNSSAVGLCIEGASECYIERACFALEKGDVWTVPNMAAQKYRNVGTDRHVQLLFTDAPVLEQLWSHLASAPLAAETHPPAERDPLADAAYSLTSGGGKIKTYHAFVDPEVVEQQPMLWKWKEVAEFLDGRGRDASDWRADMIALLWNPATGRTNGSTSTLTAFMSGGVNPDWREAKYEMARMHRHTITAVNYGLLGRWRTIVEDREILWEEGDLVITAPSWARHSNGSCDERAYTFTIQDASLQSALNASVLQEYLNRPPVHLGARRGFRA